MLLGLIVVLGLLEVTLRPDTSWPRLVELALLATLPWRRSHPFSMVAIAFGVSIAMELAGVIEPDPLGTTAFMLLLPYALVRWGSGREVAIAVPIILTAAALSLVAQEALLEEIVGGFAVLLSSMAVGAAVRYRAHARTQELQQIKLREREQLARDLHDTVAHHVSAIAIRAHAGIATASAKPEAAVDALHVIAAEASRTLDEMRAMVRTLRRGEEAELAPKPRIEDLATLAHVDGPHVEVAIEGDVATLPAAVSSTVYSLAQESITNARRHARKATRVDVSVAIDDTSVQLRVRDDGELARARTAAPGYGLLGMTERAELLGGTLHAGPNPEIGWTVTAVLPRAGKTA